MTPSPQAGRITLEQLSVDLGGKRILQNLSLTILPQSWWLVLGPNGAGKTTLLRSILGQIQPSQGQVLLEGKPIQTLTQRKRARRVSFVPQATDISIPYSVEEYVMMGRFAWQGFLGVPGIEDREKCMQALELTDLCTLKDRAVHTLSGGERQRVLLAGAVAQGAPVMLLDEPTTWLDPRHVVSILQAVSRIRDTGVTIVMVTHDVNILREAVSDVLLLDQNQRSASLTAEACRQQGTELFASFYGVPFGQVDLPRSEARLFYAGAPA